MSATDQQCLNFPRNTFNTDLLIKGPLTTGLVLTYPGKGQQPEPGHQMGLTATYFHSVTSPATCLQGLPFPACLLEVLFHQPAVGHACYTLVYVPPEGWAARGVPGLHGFCLHLPCPPLPIPEWNLLLLKTQLVGSASRGGLQHQQQKRCSVQLRASPEITEKFLKTMLSEDFRKTSANCLPISY